MVSLLALAVIASLIVFGGLRLWVFSTPAARLGRMWRRGGAALSEGRYGAAERIFRQSLALAERRFGAEHWRTALHVAALAEAVVDQERLDEAEVLLSRALRAAPPAGTRTTSAFGSVYLLAAGIAAKRKDAARRLAMLEQARIFALGGAPVLLAAIDVQRAKLLEAQGDHAAAADVARGLVPAHVSDTDAAHAGRLLLRAGAREGAVVLLRRAVEIERRRADVSGNLALLRSLVAEALELAGRLDEAQLALTMAIDTYDALSAPAIVVVPLLVKLARIELALGDAAAARAACGRALAAAPIALRPKEPYRGAEEDPLVTARADAERLLAQASRGAP